MGVWLKHRLAKTHAGDTAHTILLQHTDLSNKNIMKDLYEKLNILILENDRVQADVLKKSMASYSRDIYVCTAHSVDEAVCALKAHGYFDAFFLDISMNTDTPDTDGLKFAEELQSTQGDTAPIVFVTSYPEHTYQAINKLHCFAFLLKPYSQKDVYRQLDDICAYKKKDAADTGDNIMIRTLDGIHVKISHDDLCYIESHGRYLYYHTLARGVFCSRQYRLKELPDILPEYYVRCYRSIIVNKHRVLYVDRTKHVVRIEGAEDNIPYSDTYNITE